MLFMVRFLPFSFGAALGWLWLAAGAVLDYTAGLPRAGIVFFLLSQLTDFEADDLQVIHFLSPFVDKIKFCFSFLTIA